MGVHEYPEGAAGLRVLIVGAGIGGLAAALALRRQGHEVLIFEKSKFASEIGAAITIGPNCRILLARLALDLNNYGGTNCDGVALYDGSGTCYAQGALFGVDEEGSDEGWSFVHRAHLHKALKKLALTEEGPGRPAELFLGCNIVELDKTTPRLKLQGGEEYSGDLIVGADGVHSFTRRFIAPGARVFPYGKYCFRWLAPKSALAADERTLEFSQLGTKLIEVTAGNRRIISYPCSNNELSNMAAFVPAAKVPDDASGWDRKERKNWMLKAFQSLGTGPRALLEQAPEEELKLWQLLDMKSIQTWAEDRLVLIGDACHPFLPFMGQGGAMAIEDACALGALLPPGTTPDEITHRLRLLQTCRKERVDLIQEYARRNGRDPGNPEYPRPTYEELEEWVKYASHYDAWETAEDVLKKSRAPAPQASH